MVGRGLAVLNPIFPNLTMTVNAANRNIDRIWNLYGTVVRKGPLPITCTSGDTLVPYRKYGTL